MRARDVRYGLFLPNVGPFGDCRALVDLAVAAENAGWDGFFFWDTILFDLSARVDIVDPWVALAAVATATKTLRLGALMTALARRRPWKVAREATTVDRLSGGRLIFGAGLGYPADSEFEAFGEDADNRIRAERLDEGLDLLAALWTGSPVEHSGKHYTVNSPAFLPTPLQAPRPPIWIAGWWPNHRPFRRAAKWDGTFPELIGGEVPSPAELGEIVKYIGEFRTIDEHFDVVLNGVTPNDPQQAGAIVEPYVDLGLTWWLEKVNEHKRFSIEEVTERILAGPPSLA